jgi:hypothetical protein
VTRCSDNDDACHELLLHPSGRDYVVPGMLGARGFITFHVHVRRLGSVVIFYRDGPR